MTTEATATYTYRTTDVIQHYVLRRRKAQKQNGFLVKSTMGIVSEDEVLIDKPNSRNQRYRRRQLDH